MEKKEFLKKMLYVLEKSLDFTECHVHDYLDDSYDLADGNKLKAIIGDGDYDYLVKSYDVLVNKFCEIEGYLNTYLKKIEE